MRWLYPKRVCAIGLLCVSAHNTLTCKFNYIFSNTVIFAADWRILIERKQQLLQDVSLEIPCLQISRPC